MLTTHFTLNNTNGNDIIVASNSAAIGLTAGTYTGFIEPQILMDQV